MVVRVLGVLLAVIVLAVPARATASRVVMEQVPGTILDVQADRILFLDRSNALSIEDRQTDAITQIPSVAGKTPDHGFLTPHGAIFDVRNSSSLDELYEWRDGSLSQLLGSLNSSFSLIVKGKWAIYSGAATCCSYSLFLRDLDLGVTTTVSTDAGNIYNDVAESGEVAYWTGQNAPVGDYEIFRYQNGVSQQLTSDTTLWNTWALTDGTNIAYSKHSQCCFNDSGSVAVYTPGGEVVLDSFRNRWPDPYRDYQVAGGWVAYTHIGPSGETQVWERSPTGTLTQLSPSGQSAYIVGMDGEGGVMVDSSYLYLRRPGQAPVNLGSSSASGLPGLGNYIFWHDGSWYEATGGTLFRFVPDPGYPRPRGATPVLTALTIAYKPCTAPDREHTPPLVADSCSQHQMTSDYLTVGTGDANGMLPRSEGSVRLDSVLDKPATGPDESDVKLGLVMSDVFTKALADYAGELRAEVAVQGTDRFNAKLLHSGTIEHVDSSKTPVELTTTADHGLQDGAVVGFDDISCGGTITVTGPRTFFVNDTEPPTCEDATGFPWYEVGFRDPGPGTFDFTLGFIATCVPTADTTVGSICSASTSANAVVPGVVRAGYRTISQLGQVKVYDGGSDSDGDTTADNTLFADEGIFVP
jgi:hypothetical protein